MVHAFAKARFIKATMLRLSTSAARKFRVALAASIIIEEAMGNASKKMICKRCIGRETAEMIVIASPIYYFGFSGQLQCAIHRTYAVESPEPSQGNVDLKLRQ
jgi:hypothetical protein